MIIFDPETFAEKKLKGLKVRFYKNDITKNVKSFAMKYLDKEEQNSFFKIIKGYKRRLKEARKKDKNLSNREILNDYKQVNNLLKDMIVYNELINIKERYSDEFFIWLPSSSDNPRHSHMMYYGKKYSLSKGVDGKGLLPGMEYGCKCGMMILTDEDEEEQWERYGTRNYKPNIKVWDYDDYENTIKRGEIVDETNEELLDRIERAGIVKELKSDDEDAFEFREEKTTENFKSTIQDIKKYFDKTGREFELLNGIKLYISNNGIKSSILHGHWSNQKLQAFRAVKDVIFNDIINNNYLTDDKINSRDCYYANIVIDRKKYIVVVQVIKSNSDSRLDFYLHDVLEINKK